ncbi:hypothetical protein EDD16DRAFT_1733395 [Pisolithus croceorrhizus]|nr:hypothetical protein EDD16DRAFT_1733395 [Pisolithus croceorrhizus]
MCQCSFWDEVSRSYGMLVPTSLIHAIYTAKWCNVYGSQLAAFQHIHSLSVVPRDIKSENLTCALDDPLTIKLIDFDTSKSFFCDQLAAQYESKSIRLFPSRFGERLTYSRSLAFDQFPNHNSPRDSIANLADKLGFSVDNGPLDWTPCYPKTTNPIPDEPTLSIPDQDQDSGGDGDLGENSHYGTNTDIWDRQGERDKGVTLPGEHEVELDSIILLTEEVPRD